MTGEASDSPRRAHQDLTPSDRLNGVGLRATGPRLRILELFEGRAHCHATADDIFRALRERGNDVGLATVYRVLSHLTEVGILARSTFDDGVAVYELRPEHAHDHIVCLACGRIDEVVDPVIDERIRAVARTAGYVTTSRHLALYGFCPGCRVADGPASRRRAGMHEPP